MRKLLNLYQLLYLLKTNFLLRNVSTAAMSIYHGHCGYGATNTKRLLLNKITAFLKLPKYEHICREYAFEVKTPIKVLCIGLVP